MMQDGRKSRKLCAVPNKQTKPKFSLLSTFPNVPGHDALPAVLVGQHEGAADLVLPVVVAGTAGGHHATTAAVTSLVECRNKSVKGVAR